LSPGDRVTLKVSGGDFRLPASLKAEALAGFYDAFPELRPSPPVSHFAGVPLVFNPEVQAEAAAKGRAFYKLDVSSAEKKSSSVFSESYLEQNFPSFQELGNMNILEQEQWLSHLSPEEKAKYTELWINSNSIYSTGPNMGDLWAARAGIGIIKSTLSAGTRQVAGQGGKGLGKTAELEKRLEEHIKKLQEYIKNPLANDNKNFLKNAPTQGIEDSIITGRVKHLVDEIKNLTNLINQGGGQ
jgi:hypothetical protein